ncbi:hypothetical protein [Desulfocurvus sp. DL9XJH121]
MTDSGYQDWMLDCLVDDDLFAEAYGSMPGERRAWIKQTAAQAHALAGAAPAVEERRDVLGRQGYRVLRELRPVEYAVMFLDSTCLSPARVAAVAVPMVLSGARHVCAVRVSGGPPAADAVLTALELSGLETVFHLDEGAARRFTAFLSDLGSAAVVFCGRGPELSALAAAAGYASPPLKLWRPLPGERLGVWAGAGGDWDWETLAWAHPCSEFEVWGARSGLPDLPVNFKAARGGFERFLEAGYPALYVPEARLGEALGHAPLVLAPGQEGCWAWPDLPMSFSRSETLAIGAWNR